jgi:hypothetical protein
MLARPSRGRTAHRTLLPCPTSPLRHVHRHPARRGPPSPCDLSPRCQTLSSGERELQLSMIVRPRRASPLLDPPIRRTYPSYFRLATRAVAGPRQVHPPAHPPRPPAPGVCSARTVGRRRWGRRAAGRLRGSRPRSHSAGRGNGRPRRQNIATSGLGAVAEANRGTAGDAGTGGVTGSSASSVPPTPASTICRRFLEAGRAEPGALARTARRKVTSQRVVRARPASAPS